MNQNQKPGTIEYTKETHDLEIKDAQLIFQQVWQDLIAKFKKENLRFPREIIWLGGAPGAGKGTNTPYIIETRGISAAPIVISSLLNNPEAEKIKNAGGMVGDKEVVTLLLFELLNPIYESGVVVDGFPRTKVQVECLKLFFETMLKLREEFETLTLSKCFIPSRFHLVLLFIDEKKSVERQFSRGCKVKEHNKKVQDSGVGTLLEERSTDYSEGKARKRYKVFKETTYEALKSLREIYHYHFIDASGSPEMVQENISREFQYQSSLELAPSIYDRIRNIPLASQVILHARQNLIKRLEDYQNDYTELFGVIIKLIENEFIPIIKRHAISGLAIINTNNNVFNDKTALDILIDILIERGYQVAIDTTTVHIPEKINPVTNSIQCLELLSHRIEVKFTACQIRRGIS